MSTNYRLIIMDEFDWEYANKTKQDVLSYMVTSTSLFIESSSPYMIILDCGTQWPSRVCKMLNKNGVSIDRAYYQAENNAELKEVDWNE